MVAVAGLIDALHYAGAAEVPAVLAAVGDAELAAGIAGAALPVAVAVSDFVLDRAAGDAGDDDEAKGSAALLALTRRALVDETVADPDAVLRALIRLADPAVDELLVRDDSPLRPRGWMLRALVRDRRGADGRPVIAPGVERFLRQQVSRLERRLAGYDRPHPARIERLLLIAALFADDPDLAAFALPAGIRFEILAGSARALETLREYGRLAELWDGGLRASIEELAKAPSHYRYSNWRALLEIGDADAPAKLPFLLRRSLSSAVLPAPDDADRWTAPDTASQHYELDWDTVLAYAAVVGTGDEETQAGQSTARGLDEAAAREDMPEDVRPVFEERYPRAVYWTARPGVAALICAAHGGQAAGGGYGPNPAARHFGLRELLRRGLLHGSLTAADAVAYAMPPADVLALAVPTPPGLAEYYTAKGDNSFHPHNARVPAEAEERYQADLRAAVAEAIGPDPDRWLKVLTRVGGWEDSLGELVRQLADGEEPGLPRQRAHRWPRGIDPAAVLLDIAPEGVLDAVLAVATQAAAGAEAAGAGATGAEAGVSETAAANPTDSETRTLLGIITRILDRGPVPRRLLDHALGPHGTTAMRLAAARNPAATGGTLWRIADREPAEPGVLAAVYLHPLASRELRVAAVVRSEAAGGLYPGLVRRLVTRYAQEEREDLLLPALESRSPEVLNAVLRRGGRLITTGQRLAAYGRLAAAAGPEPVWALELERAGSLERMHPAVRASIAEHSDAPLRAAAAEVEAPDPVRVAGDWDAAFHPSRPDTADRVRALLDGRPERWLRLLEPGTTLPGLLAELGSAQPPAAAPPPEPARG